MNTKLVLGISSGSTIPPGGRCHLVVRSSEGFLPDHIIVPEDGSEDFVIERIAIDHWEQLLGSMSLSLCVGSFPLKFKYVSKNSEVMFIVKNIGLESQVFRAALAGDIVPPP
jgi:hypothetical protein